MFTHTCMQGSFRGFQGFLETPFGFNGLDFIFIQLQYEGVTAQTEELAQLCSQPLCQLYKYAQQLSCTYIITYIITYYVVIRIGISTSLTLLYTVFLLYAIYTSCSYVWGKLGIHHGLLYCVSWSRSCLEAEKDQTELWG